MRLTDKFVRFWRIRRPLRFSVFFHVDKLPTVWKRELEENQFHRKHIFSALRSYLSDGSIAITWYSRIIVDWYLLFKLLTNALIMCFYIVCINMYCIYYYVLYVLIYSNIDDFNLTTLFATNQHVMYSYYWCVFLFALQTNNVT